LFDEGIIRIVGISRLGAARSHRREMDHGPFRSAK
jgi:hypothetical protein